MAALIIPLLDHPDTVSRYALAPPADPIIVLFLVQDVGVILSQASRLRPSPGATPDVLGFNEKNELQYRGRLDESRMTLVKGARRELYEAMTLVAGMMLSEAMAADVSLAGDPINRIIDRLRWNLPDVSATLAPTHTVILER